MSPVRLAAAFQRDPRLLALTLGGVLVAGLSAFQLLPRAEDPVLSGRVARVVTRLPGANPERVEALVTRPLEDELLEVAELERVVSDSRNGISVIVLEVADEVEDTGPVWAQVRDRLDDARPRLGAGASLPELEEMTIVAYTLITAIVPEEGRPAPERGVLRRLALSLRDRLRTLPGSDDVDVYGAAEEEVRVELDPAQLVSLGATPRDLAAAVAGSDAKLPAGQLRSGERDLLLEVSGELRSLERVRELPVRSGPDGRVVRLGDVARVSLTSADPPRELALLDGREGVAVAARMGSGGRVDRWSAAARSALDDWARQLPAGLRLEVLFDQSRYTEARLDGLLWNLVLGAGLVMGVLWLLMGWRSAVLVGAALPLTSLAVLAGMRALAVPIHQMSVTGLIIALGLLIDNAIVMVDEVRQRLARGLAPAAALAAAVSHLAVPLAASTVTTALTFMPMVLMPGPSGEFVGAIGLTVILALGSSLLLSLTVLPVLALLLGLRPATSSGRWWSEGWRDGRALERYRALLDSLLARPGRTAVLALVPALLGFAAAPFLEEQFFPPVNRDQVLAELRLPGHAALGGTREAAERASAVLREQPEVQAVHWFLGRTAPKFYYNMLSGQDGAAFFAQALIQLRDAEHPAETVARLQRRLDEALPQAQAVVKQLEQGPPFEAPVEVFLRGPDLRVLAELGEQVRLALSEIPDVIQTRASLQDGQPLLQVRLEEEEARRAGLDNAALARQLEDALLGASGGALREGVEELPVRVQVVAEARAAADGISSLPLLGPMGPAGVRPALPFSSVAELTLTPGVSRITRREGERTNTVQAFVRAGVLPSRVLGRLRPALAELPLPPGYRVEVGGESRERDRAVTNLLGSAGLLLVLMVGTLVLSFGSFRQAGLIGLVGVLSVGLALGALWLAGYPFGFMAIVGTMGLIGVAINDSIVVLAALKEDPAAARGDTRAAREVVVGATRHVVATTVTTAAGFAPLLLGGDPFWAPLAITIVGGVVGSTLLALTLVPACFLLLTCSGRAPSPRAAPEPVPVAPGAW